MELSPIASPVDFYDYIFFNSVNSLTYSVDLQDYLLFNSINALTYSVDLHDYLLFNSVNSLTYSVDLQDYLLFNSINALICSVVFHGFILSNRYNTLMFSVVLLVFVFSNSNTPPENLCCFLRLSIFNRYIALKPSVVFHDHPFSNREYTNASAFSVPINIMSSAECLIYHIFTIHGYIHFHLIKKEMATPLSSASSLRTFNQQDTGTVLVTYCTQ